MRACTTKLEYNYVEANCGVFYEAMVGGLTPQTAMPTLGLWWSMIKIIIGFDQSAHHRPIPHIPLSTLSHPPPI